MERKQGRLKQNIGKNLNNSNNFLTSKLFKNPLTKQNSLTPVSLKLKDKEKR